jgi:hypothetical protein
MKDRDPLVEAVAAAVRTKPILDDLDPRWDDLTRGTLDPEVAAELAASMNAGDVLRLQAAFAPPREDTIRAITASVLRRPAYLALMGDSQASVNEDELAASVKQRPPARERAWPRFAAMAASVLVLLGAAITWRLIAPLGARALPAYSLELMAGDRRDRSEATAPVVELRPQSYLEVVLRPASAPVQPVNLSSWLEHDGALVHLGAKPERSASGSFRLAGTAADLGLREPGVWRLIFFVGSPAALPHSEPEARAWLHAGPSGDAAAAVHMLVQQVEVIAGGL